VNRDLLLNFAIDAGRNTEHDHEQRGDCRNDDPDEANHKKRSKEIDDEVHGVPP